MITPKTQKCTGCKQYKKLSGYYGQWPLTVRRCKKCFKVARRKQYLKRRNTPGYKKKALDYYNKNKKRILARCKIYQDRKRANPEYRKSENKRSADLRRKNPERRAAVKLLNRYGISEKQWLRLFKKQKGKCRICRGVNPDGRRLCIDHDKNTKIIRGLICVTCNFGIGYLKHNIKILKSAIKYLTNHANITPVKEGRAWREQIVPSQVKRMPASQRRKLGIR